MGCIGIVIISHHLQSSCTIINHHHAVIMHHHSLYSTINTLHQRSSSIICNYQPSSIIVSYHLLVICHASTSQSSISHSSLHQSFINDCRSSLHHPLFIIIIRFCGRYGHHLVNILMMDASSNISLPNALIGGGESPSPLSICPGLGVAA